jgi:transcriptional regulator with XRE-family HTH domain
MNPIHRIHRLAGIPAGLAAGGATRTRSVRKWRFSRHSLVVVVLARSVPPGAGQQQRRVARGAGTMEETGLSFGGLLRQLRDEAQLTQEELAEAASLSPRSVSDLERGINRTARKDTALLLAGALGLDGQAHELFIAAARGRGPAAAVLATREGTAPGAFAAAATRALPRHIASFTGRQAELARLMDEMDALAAEGGVVGIHAIDGMARIGKTAFAVHAAHRGDLVAGKKILLLLDDAAGHGRGAGRALAGAGSWFVDTSERRCECRGGLWAGADATARLGLPRGERALRHRGLGRRSWRRGCPAAAGGGGLVSGGGQVPGLTVMVVFVCG